MSYVVLGDSFQEWMTVFMVIVVSKCCFFILETFSSFQTERSCLLYLWSFLVLISWPRLLFVFLFPVPEVITS